MKRNVWMWSWVRKSWLCKLFYLNELDDIVGVVYLAC